MNAATAGRLWPRVMALGALLTLAASGAAWAHVEISPARVAPDAAAGFTVSVPAERSVPTTRVRLEFPEGFVVTDLGPSSGWEGEVEDGPSGEAIVWTGGEIGPDEVGEFFFDARAPDDQGDFAVDAIQTYADGREVGWTGPADAEEPAPVVEVVQAGPRDHEAAETHGAHPEGHAEGEPLPQTGGSGNLSGVVALLALAAGLVLYGTRRA